MPQSLDGTYAGHRPSMKVPPKRKGNISSHAPPRLRFRTLNESPSEKEGKLTRIAWNAGAMRCPSMKVPPKRKGNESYDDGAATAGFPSMKVPPKRKGNLATWNSP